MRVYNVYLVNDNFEDELIDTVFWVDNSDVNEVRKSLIEHDGYDPNIIVEEVK